VQRNGNYPLISTFVGEFVNIFCSLVDNRALSTLPIQNLVVENEDNYIAEM
jgi:hypothetical protein